MSVAVPTAWCRLRACAAGGQRRWDTWCLKVCVLRVRARVSQSVSVCVCVLRSTPTSASQRVVAPNVPEEASRKRGVEGGMDRGISKRHLFRRQREMEQGLERSASSASSDAQEGDEQPAA